MSIFQCLLNKENLLHLASCSNRTLIIYSWLLIMQRDAQPVDLTGGREFGSCCPFFLHDGVAAGGAQPFRGFQDAVGPGVLRAFGKVHFQNGRDDFPPFPPAPYRLCERPSGRFHPGCGGWPALVVEPDSSTGCNSATGVSTWCVLPARQYSAGWFRSGGIRDAAA